MKRHLFHLLRQCLVLLPVLAPALPLQVAAQCTALPAKQVAWWRAEGDVTDSTGGNTGTLINGATFAPGEVGQAFAFYGTNSFIEVPDSPSLSLTDELTIEFWVKRQRLDAPDYVVEKGGDWTGGAVNYGAALHTAQYNYCLHFTFAGGWRGGGSVGDLNWHHCAIVARQGDANPTFYVDGVQQPSIYGSGASTINLYPSTRPLHIGALLDGATGWYYYSRTLVDELALYNRALSASEIQTIYNAGSAGKCLSAPVFTSQPLGCSAPLGMPAGFSAAVYGTAPLSYQWQRNGTDIPNATNSSLSLPAVSTSDLGLYRLMASNGLGMAFSDPAPLTLGPVAAWGGNAPALASAPAGLSDVVNVSAGGTHNLALRADGTVAAWGGNISGELNVPADLSHVVAISAGHAHSLALCSDGSVVSWGDNSSGQTNVPAGLSNVVAVAAGAYHSLALRADGTVAAWGSSANGLTNPIASLCKVVAIAAGRYHNLALRADGTVLAWGLNTAGQAAVPVNLSNVVAIAAGAYHSLALRAEGSVAAWGMNTFGQAPPPATLSNATAIAAGFYHSLALRADGTVVAWGSNDFGQTNSFAALTNVVALAAGDSQSLALVGDGRPLLTRQPTSLTGYAGRPLTLQAAAAGTAPLSFQWQKEGVAIPGATTATLNLAALSSGDQGSYRLTVTNALGATASFPVTVTVLDGAAPFFLSAPASPQVGYLGSRTTLGLSVGGPGPLQYQWRLNGQDLPGATTDELVFDPLLLPNAGSYSLFVSNQFGAATSPTGMVKVVQVRTWGSSPVDPPASVSNVVAVAAGSYGYLALRSDGKVVNWGSTGPAGPVPATLSNAVAIAAGADHNVALRSDGSVFVWGFNNFGQTNVPPGAAGVTAIAAGNSHDVALRSDGTVVAWGMGYNGQTNVPAGLAGVVGVAAGAYHGLALKSDGTVVGWGSSSSYQPIPGSATNLVAIAAGSYHSLGLRADGTVVAWGQNGSGQCAVPAGLSNVVGIAAGAYHSVALCSDGTVVAWGSSKAVTPLVDISSAIQIAAGGDNGVTLFGTRSPAVTVQPFSRTLLRGTNTTFVAKAAGAPPLAYQWRFKGADIPGATTDTLSLTNLRFSQSGAYQLVVSNAYGVAATLKAKLMVTLPLNEVLDATNLAWTSSGGAAWFGQTETTLDGVNAARSGAIGNSQESILQTTLIGPGRLTWSWKVSSEPNFDKLEFRVNGVSQFAVSGEVDWEPRSFVIPSGTQTLQWRYSKDVSFSGGQDAAWVDQVAFVADPPVLTSQPYSQTVDMGGQVWIGVGATGSPPLTYQWLQNGIPLPGAVASSFYLASATRTNSGSYSVRVSNPGGSILSSNAAVKVLVPQRLGTPTLLPDGSLSLTSGDADGGLLTPADLASFEAQASTNLVNWVPLPDALSLTNGSLQLRDLERTNHPSRFYRILEN